MHAPDGNRTYDLSWRAAAALLFIGFFFIISSFLVLYSDGYMFGD
jgi:hypothetical protein